MIKPAIITTFFLFSALFNSCNAQKFVYDEISYSKVVEFLDDGGGIIKSVRLDTLSIGKFLLMINRDKSEFSPLCRGYYTNCKWVLWLSNSLALIVYPSYGKNDKKYWNVYENENPSITDVLNVNVSALEIRDRYNSPVDTSVQFIKKGARITLVLPKN